MAVSTAIVSDRDIRAFIEEYSEAWSGTDEDLILSYYSEAISLEIPGAIIDRKAGPPRPVCSAFCHLLSWKPSIRPGKAASDRSPYSFRRYDPAQTDFIAPASSAAEPSDRMVRRTGLSKVRERVRICPIALSHSWTIQGKPYGVGNTSPSSVRRFCSGRKSYQSRIDVTGKVAHCLLAA